MAVLTGSRSDTSQVLHRDHVSKIPRKQEKNIGDEQISDMLIELFEGVCLRKVMFVVGVGVCCVDEEVRRRPC